MYRLNPQEIGDAITQYIGREYESATFFPYRISKMIMGEQVTLLNEVIIELEFIPKDTKAADAEHTLP